MKRTTPTRQLLLGTLLLMLAMSVSMVWAPSSIHGIAASQPTVPTLSVESGLTARTGQTVAVPINFATGGGNTVGAMAFTVQFDTACLAFDGSDNNSDGIPDAMSFDPALPASFTKIVLLNDVAAGRINIALFALSTTARVPSPSSLVTIDFTVICRPTGSAQNATIRFRANTASFGSTSGQSIAGDTVNGFVTIEPTTTEPTDDVYFLSSTSGGRLENASRTRFADEDIVIYNPSTDEWRLVFDGSDVGLRKADVDAFALDPVDGNWLMSFHVPVRIPDLGWVDDSDIVKFTPTQLGDNTSGDYSLYFDASAFELSSNAEDVDAVAFVDFDTETPKLAISTIGTARVSSGRYKDEDMIVWNPATNSWELYYDGSVVKLSSGSEDTSSAWIDGENLYLTTKGNYTAVGLNSQKGDSDDIILCERRPVLNCLFSLHWNGDDHSFRRESIDALAFGSLDLSTLSARSGQTVVDDRTVIDFEVDLSQEGSAGEEIDNFDLIQPEEDETVLTYELWLPAIFQE